MVFIVKTNLREFEVDLVKEVPLTNRGGLGGKKAIANKLRKREEILEIYVK